MERLYRVACLVMAWLFLLLVPALLWAQGVDVTAPSSGADVNAASAALSTAIEQKGGFMAIAGAAVFFALQLVKYPQFGNLMLRLPPRVRFYAPYVLGGLVGFFGDLGQGNGWLGAVVGVFTIGPIATVLHQGHKTVRPAAMKPVNHTDTPNPA